MCAGVIFDFYVFWKDKYVGYLLFLYLDWEDV